MPLAVTVAEAEGVTVGVALALGGPAPVGVAEGVALAMGGAVGVWEALDVMEGVAVGDRVGGGEGDAPQSSCRTAERSAT